MTTQENRKVVLINPRATYCDELAQKCYPPMHLLYLAAAPLTVFPQNPASIAVEFQVRNAGTVSSGWECTVRARDESNTYTGWATFNQDTPLSANSSTMAIGTIMITNEGSAYVNEVWVDGCEARATPTEAPGTSEASG